MKTFVLRILFSTGGKNMKREDSKPPVWEAKDPKPPVIQSGHMENRKQNER